MITVDALDVVLRVQNLRAFQAGMGQASASVRGVGAAAGTSAKQTDALTRSQRRAAGSLGLVHRAGRNAAIAAGVAAYAGLKMGIKLDQQMNQIKVVTGESTDSIKKLRGNLLDLARPTGFDPEKLAESMAHISKIDLPGVDRLKLLKAAADGAVVGMADLVTTTDTLAGAIKVGMPGLSKDVRTAMGQLIAAAQTGNMSLEDFNHAMGTGILPVAKAYGLSLTDVTGALAVFTDEHMQGSSATAQLATSFHFLTGATEGAEKALETMGLSGTQMADAMRSPRGLLKALTMLHDHLNAFSSNKSEQEALLNKILPGGRGRILMVLMNQLDNYNQKMDQQDKQTTRHARNIVNTHHTSAQKIRDSWAGLKADLIETTDSKAFQNSVSIMVDAVDLLVKAIKALRVPLVIALGLFLAWKGAMIAAGIATAIWEGLMTVAVASLYLWDAAVALATLDTAGFALAMEALNLAFLANPVTWIILAVVALIAVVYILYKKWKWFHNAVDNTWHWIKRHWKLLAVILSGPFAPVTLVVLQIIKHIKSIIGLAESAYKKAMKIKDDLTGNNPIKHERGRAYLSAFAPGRRPSDMTDAEYLHYQRLGIMEKPGQAGFKREYGPEGPSKVIRTGERPSPRSKRVHTPDPVAAPSLGKTPFVNHTHVYLDGKELTSVFTKKIADKRARK